MKPNDLYVCSVCDKYCREVDYCDSCGEYICSNCDNLSKKASSRLHDYEEHLGIVVKKKR